MGMRSAGSHRALSPGRTVGAVGVKWEPLSGKGLSQRMMWSPGERRWWLSEAGGAVVSSSQVWMYSEGRVDRICRWANLSVREGEELGCWCKELKELPFTKWGQPGRWGNKEVALDVLHCGGHGV